MDDSVHMADYPIQPQHIKTEGSHFWDSFGETHKEGSAWWIVRYCQERGNWGPFTAVEMDNFYRSYHPNGAFHFMGLLDPKYIQWEGDQLRVTHLFIATCFRSSPNYPIPTSTG